MDLETIRTERLLLADRLQPLNDADWNQPSLCAGWTIKHVLAHVVTPFTIDAPTLLKRALRKRSIALALDSFAKEIAESHTTDQLLSTLRANAASPFRPPGAPLAAPLTDIVAHSADVRWALKDPVGDWEQPARLIPALDYSVSKKAQITTVKRGRLNGLQFVATDQIWIHGSGTEIRGPSVALLMAILGRPIALSLLEGEGVALLDQRLHEES